MTNGTKPRPAHEVERVGRPTDGDLCARPPGVALGEREGDLDDEGGAVAGLALDGDRALEGEDDAAGDRQA